MTVPFSAPSRLREIQVAISAAGLFVVDFANVREAAITSVSRSWVSANHRFLCSEPYAGSSFTAAKSAHAQW